MRTSFFVAFAAITVAVSILLSLPAEPASACDPAPNPSSSYWFTPSNAPGEPPASSANVVIIDAEALVRRYARDRDGLGCDRHKCGPDYAVYVDVRLVLDADGNEASFGYDVELEGTWPSGAEPFAVRPGTTELQFSQGFSRGEPAPSEPLRVRVIPVDAYGERGTPSEWFMVFGSGA